MNVLATEYSLKHKALEIYLAGCKGPHCPGCHNPESWDFNQGSPFFAVLSDIRMKVEKFGGSLVKQLWVLGGEPLDQDPLRLAMALTLLCELERPIVLFTRYELGQIPRIVRHHCDFIKTGRYDQSLPEVECHPHIEQVPGITLASSNQQLHVLDVDY